MDFVKHASSLKPAAFFSSMLKENIFPDLFTYTTLIDGLCKEGNISRARSLLRQILQDGMLPDVAAYTALISGLFREGELDEGKYLLDKMLEQGLVPNIATIDSLIRGFCRKGFCKKDGMLEMCHLLDKMLVKR